MKLQRAFFVVVALVFVASFASVVSGASKVRNVAQVGSASSSPVIERLVLINADTDQAIGELTPGYVIDTASLGVTRFNIEAKTNPPVVGSVGWKLDNLAVRTENTAPYAYAGDNGQGNFNSFTMTPGNHSLVVTPYTLSNRTGVAGQPLSISFTVGNSTSGTQAPISPVVTPTGSPTPTSNPASTSVTSFVLVNSDTNQDIMPITNGSTINLAMLGTDKLTLRADTTAIPSLPGSVKFKVNGQNYSTENLWPFTIPAGVANDDYRPWSFNLNQPYEITATPYSGSSGSGTVGTPLSVNFTVIPGEQINSGTPNQPSSNVSVPPIACMNATLTYTAGAQGPAQINAYWDAVAGVTNYRTWRQKTGEDEVLLQDMTTGTSIYTTNLSPGTYALRAASLVFDSVAHVWVQGEKKEISVTVGSSGSTSNFTTCTPSSGLTSAISVTSPANNANILSNQNFNFSISATPTPDQIAEVKFYYRGEFENILLGTDTTGPDFSLPAANLGGIRGFSCPHVFAEARLFNSTKIKTPRRNIVVTDTTATTPLGGCPGNGEMDVDLNVTTSFPGASVSAGQQFSLSTSVVGSAVPEKVKFFHMGGNVAQNIASGAPAYTITNIATLTTPPYTTTYTINSPGNYGSPSATDQIRVVAFFSNGATNTTTIPIKVTPAAAQPRIGSLTLLRSNGNVISSITPGMAINIGTQSNTNTPLGQDISVRAEPSGSPLPAPASVKFTLSGPPGTTPIERIENSAPFSLFGDSLPNYTAWPQPITLGGYTLTATPYSQTGAQGTPGTSMSVTFQIVNLDDATPPSQPQGVNVTYRSANQIRLSWSASTDPETGIQSYSVTRNPGSTVNVGNATTFTDTTGITSSGAYSYTVTALNNVGQSSSASAAVAAPALSTQFSVGNNVQTNVATFVKTAADGTNQTPQQPIGALGSIIGGPVYFSNVQYWQVNFANNPDGWVAQSNLTLQAPVDTQAPNNVTGLTVGSPTTSSLALSWNPSTDNGGGSVSGYKVYRSSTQNGTYSLVAGSPVAGNSFTDSSLNSSTTYWYKVTAIDNATPTANESALTSATAVSGQTTGSVSSTCTPGTAPNTNGSNRSVELSSSISTSPASITICWANITGRTISGPITVSRKEGYTSTTWTTLTSSLAASSTSYTDTTAVSGTYYEYKVSFPQTSTSTSSGPTHNTSGTATGYIATGINVPLESYKGKVILLVDNTFQNSHAAQIQTLTDDLNADRWAVLPLYVSRTDTALNVRNQVIALYNSHQNVKAVYIIGHVPVYTGSYNPDGHGATAWSTDTYYGEMGTWASTVGLDLQIGRVDPYNMPAFGGNEGNILTSYLNKVSEFKRKQFTPNPRAIVRDGLNAPGQNGALNWPNGSIPWATFPSIVGVNNVTVSNSFSPLFTTLMDENQSGDQSYTFAYAIAGGACDRDNDNALGTTSTFASTNYGAVFNIYGGSYFGNWNNCADNFLKAPLFSGKGMVNLYALDRHWYLHGMAMGQNVGFSTRASINNTGVYAPIGGIWNTSYQNNGYMSPMGDPTLRMTYFGMPASLTISNSSGVTAFSWGSVAGAEGYNIYEIQPVSVQTNTIRKINSAMLSGTSFTSSEAFTAGKKYMVTAVDLTTSGSGGTYYNESLGRIATASGGAQQDTNAPSSPSGVAVNGTPTSSSITLSWNASTGNPAGESVFYKVFMNAGGATAVDEVTPVATGLTTPTFTKSTGLSAGTSYTFKVSAYDAAGNSSALMPSVGYAVSTAMLADTSGPSVPTGVSVSATTQNSIALSWNASTDTGGGTVAGYKIWRSPTATPDTSYVQVGTSISTNFTDTGLNPSTTWFYKISAYDNAPTVNQSGFSSGVSGTTSAAIAGGGGGAAMGLMGAVGPDNTVNVTPAANSLGVNYYIAYDGSDTNNGTSISTPWKTISKLNTQNLQPGDKVFFKRGPVGTAVYRGSINAYHTGTAAEPISYEAYGTGEAPVISGALAATNWTLHSGNIYKANIGSGKPVKYVFVGSNPQTLARSPNTDVNGNDVFWTTDDQNGNQGSNTTSITDASLPSSSSNNLVGAYVVDRHSNWAYTRGVISSHSGNTIAFATNAVNTYCYNPDCSGSVWINNGWGYWVEGKLNMLDKAGEWFYDSATGDLYFWAPGNVNPNTLLVEATVDDKGFNFGINKDYVQIKNLIIEKFNQAGIYIGNSYNALIDNVEIRNSWRAIEMTTDSTDVAKGNFVQDSYIHDTYFEGVRTGGYGHTYQRNLVENISIKPGLGSDTTGWNFMAFLANWGLNNIKQNIIRNIGYAAIDFHSKGVIEENLIQDVSLKLNDGCAICGDGMTLGTIIRNNIIDGAHGNIDGVPTSFIHAEPIGSGISTGENVNTDIEIYGNTVTDVANGALTLDHSFNSRRNKVYNNTVFLSGEESSSGLKATDQSAGVAGACSSNCVVSNYLNEWYNNDVYVIHPTNYKGMWISNTKSNSSNQISDFGYFNNNYIMNPYKLDNITPSRTMNVAGDVVEIKANPDGSSMTATVFSQPNAASPAGTHVTGDNGVISNLQVINGYYWWQINFATGVDGYIQDYQFVHAPLTVSEWQSFASEPSAPSGVTTPNKQGYTIASSANFPQLYLNPTMSTASVNIGSGKCDKNKNPLSNPYSLAAMKSVVVHTCSVMP